MVPAPPPATLDASQCIQGAYDEANGRIRVDAEITASIIAPPGLEVSISASDDNIAIRNSDNNNELLINPDGSINVTSAGGSSDTNLIQIAGTAVSVNNGVANAGTLRVAIASDNSAIAVTGPLTDAQLRATPVPVSGAVSFTTPQHVILDSGILTSITDVVQIADNGGSITVDGPLTDTELRASAVPISAASLPLPSGAATSANQATEIISLSSIDSKLNTLGQKTSASSVPVVIASDQSAIPVTGTITTSPDVNVHDGSGTSISSTGSSLNTNVTNFPATQPISAASLPLPSGASTSALQTSGNASLTSIDGKLNSLGQKIMTGSVPVVIASDQSAIPVTGTITTSPNVNIHDAAGNSLTSTLVNSKQSLDTRSNEGFATSSNTRVLIAVSPTTTILAANANRRYAYIANNTGSTVYLKLGGSAVNLQGLRLPGNSIYEITSINLFTGSIDAIGAAVTLDIYEGTT